MEQSLSKSPVPATKTDKAGPERGDDTTETHKTGPSRIWKRGLGC